MHALTAVTPSAWEDALLAWRLRAGSGAALARVYEKHRHALLRVATGLLADRAQAEDVVQEVFLRLARSPELVRQDGNLRAFLCTCVANQARNANRKGRIQCSGTDADVESISVGDENPACWIIRHDDMAALADALARLPEEQREVVVLHLRGGLRFREIAASTGVSINTAQSRYRYGIDKLRAQLNGGFPQ